MSPAAYDPLSAMLIERAGFRVITIANGPVARSFGFDDVGIVSITEQVAHAARIVDAVSLPVIADCEMPGTAANVVRAAREFERAGVAAIGIEDEAVLGQSTGGGVSAVATEVFCDWIKAVVDRRADPWFAIIARLENRGEGYDRIVERGIAAAEAGADALWIGHLNPEETAQIVKAMPVPMVGVAPVPRVPAAYLALGYKIAVLPGSIARAACWGMERYLDSLKETGHDAEFFSANAGAKDVAAWFDAIGSDAR